MNLTKVFRGVTKDVNQLYLGKFDQGLSFHSSYSQRGNSYYFNISPSDYLNVAKKSCTALASISGMEYRVMAKHPLDTVWREL